MSQTLPRYLDMGIWWNDGERIWLPKEFCPTRNDAKRFAVRECYSDWILVRVRTVWVKEIPHEVFADESHYERSDRHDPDAFECWEIDT